MKFSNTAIHMYCAAHTGRLPSVGMVRSKLVTIFPHLLPRLYCKAKGIVSACKVSAIGCDAFSVQGIGEIKYIRYIK